MSIVNKRGIPYHHRLLRLHRHECHLQIDGHRHTRVGRYFQVFHDIRNVDLPRPPKVIQQTSDFQNGRSVGFEMDFSRNPDGRRSSHPQQSISHVGGVLNLNVCPAPAADRDGRVLDRD